MPNAGDLNRQPHSDLRNLGICFMLRTAQHPVTKLKFFEGFGSGVCNARRKQEEQGGSVTYEVQSGLLRVKVAAIPTPRSTEGDATGSAV